MTYDIEWYFVTKKGELVEVDRKIRETNKLYFVLFGRIRGFRVYFENSLVVYNKLPIHKYNIFSEIFDEKIILEVLLKAESKTIYKYGYYL